MKSGQILYKILSGIAAGALIFATPTVYADVTLAPTHPSAPQTLAELRVSDPTEVARLPRFDSRDYGIITPVKDQKDSDLCWAYSAISASEAAILREGIDPSATKDTLSLSAEGLGYLRHNRAADPLKNTLGEITEHAANWYHTSGNSGDGATVLSQWCGPLKSDEAINMNTAYANTAYLMERAVCLENAKDRDAIKRAIAQYGAVTFSYNNKRECDYYNAYNETGSSAYPHACTLIGWDDTIPAEKFQPGGAKQDGGWIVKNSYHSLPYFYLSYDCGSSNLVAFDYAPRDLYDYNYFYDGRAQDFGLNVKGNDYAANVFEAKKGEDGKSEFIQAVNVGVNGKGVTCEIAIYTDLQDAQDISDISNTVPAKGTLAVTQTAQFEHAGYYTVTLDTPVRIEKGSYFSVVAKVSNTAGTAAVRLTSDNKRTYFFKDYWFKSKYAARIKAFTVVQEEEAAAPPEGYTYPYRIVGHRNAESQQMLTVNAECYQSDNPATLLCAAYHEDGTLAGVESKSVIRNAGERFTVTFAQTGKRFQIFIWNAQAALQPLSEVYAIP
uniref:Peptidase C1A papain C-terminal domain-containing protein n=1 Tax=uncultured Bacillota bacterium TaxID=344338 RepID=A0A650EME0_9FIRM|nr:hypothetical protein Firmicute1046_0830 [uncultured Firmicutes bacterium]